MISWTNNL